MHGATAFSLPLFFFASAIVSGAPVTLDAVLREVATQNPMVQSARAGAAAAREKIPQAAAWEDPVVGVNSIRDDSLRPTDYHALEFSVVQKIPVTAQRSRRVALARAEAAQAESEADAQVTPLMLAATDAFFRLLRARELLGLIQETDAVLARAVSAQQLHAANGTGNVAGLLLAETERTRLQEQVIALRREEADALARLNALRNVPSASELEVSRPAADKTGEVKLDSFETLLAEALAYRPELKAAAARVTAADRATDLNRAWLPDPEVSLFARHLRGRSDPISEYDAMVAISLPWVNQRKYRAAIKESEHRREAANLDDAALRSQTALELREAWNAFAAADQQVALYRDRLEPLAERSFEAARSGLDSGSSGILELIAAEKNQREIREALTGALADRAGSLAQLQAMTGRPLLFTP